MKKELLNYIKNMQKRYPVIELIQMTRGSCALRDNLEKQQKLSNKRNIHLPTYLTKAKKCI